MANKKRKTHCVGKTGYRSDVDYSMTTKPKSPFKRIVDHYADRPLLFVGIVVLSIIVTLTFVQSA